MQEHITSCHEAEINKCLAFRAAFIIIYMESFLSTSIAQHVLQYNNNIVIRYILCFLHYTYGICTYDIVVDNNKCVIIPEHVTPRS